MQIEDGKTYLTAGGYIITIRKNGSGSYSDKSNPGINEDGESCSDIYDGSHGWTWDSDGTIDGLTPEWTEKLRIVREFDLPEVPEGYEFADEYPMFRVLKKGEYAYSDALSFPTLVTINKTSLGFIALKKKETTEVWPKYYKRVGDELFNNNAKYRSREKDGSTKYILQDSSTIHGCRWCGYSDTFVEDGTWIEAPESEVKEWLESYKKVEEVYPKYYSRGSNIVIYRTSKDTYDQYYNVCTPCFNVPWDNHNDDEVENGLVKEITEEEFWERAKVLNYPPDPVRYGKEVSVTETESHTKEPLVDWKESLKSYIQSKPNHFYNMSNFYVTHPILQKENSMTPETAAKITKSTVSTAAKYGFKAANYFMIEPIVNITKPILRSFRYAVCVGTLVTGFYAYHNPDVVTDTIKSCLPKVTVESPEIFKS